jgi:hypothetical protein
MESETRAAADNVCQERDQLICDLFEADVCLTK